MSAEDLKKTTDFALLGVLALGGPMSGYDMRNYISLSIAQFWSESFGQIYPSLERMKKSGLVQSETDQASSRHRQIYRITDRGRTALRNWMARPPEPEKPRSEMILKTMLGNQTDPQVLVEHLEKYAQEAMAKARHLRRQQAMVKRSDAGTPELPFAIAAIRAGIHVNRARAAWARETIRELSGPGEKK
jgi:PadR family transcriptional regulator, regulatory protein AphA